MSLRRILSLVAVFTSLAAPGQQPFTFDAVTIKPHEPKPPYGWNLEATADGYEGKNVSLYKLIQEAYGDELFVRDPKLITGGPSWVNTEKFDLQAKYDPSSIPNAKNLTYRQKADMLRPILADRFHLKIHFEKRDLPVFNLVVAKNGVKVKPSKPVQSAAGYLHMCIVRRKTRISIPVVCGPELYHERSSHQAALSDRRDCRRQDRHHRPL